MKKFLLFLFVFSASVSFAQQHKTENLVIVTLDGMRWQEVFGGGDPVLMKDKRFTHDSGTVAALFGGEERTERCRKLFPFLWSTVAVRGQLYGDRLSGSEVNNANPYKFMKHATCYVLSSSWEGFPNSLIEAMYLNGCVISTNCSTGPSEIITHNVDGILCEQDNPDELANAMEKMCFDEEFRRTVYENSRIKIAGFDESIMINKYRNLFLKSNQ